MQKQNIALSKTLSWLLRHNLNKTNLTVTSDGYVKINDILLLDEFKGASFEQILEVVKTNDKQRFSLTEKEGTYFIRANQGHSKEVGDLINEKELLKELDYFSAGECIHGTNPEAWIHIETEGLKTMDRTHIHFATSLDVKSGIRKNSKVLIYVDMKKAMDDGITFYISENKVILTKGKDGILHPKYFDKVVLQ